MQFLNIFPFFLFAWTMAIFAYQSYTDESYTGLFFYLIMVSLFCYIALLKSKTIKQSIDTTVNKIAFNAALLPLLYSNLILSRIIIKAEEINESGMVFVLVLIYSPIIYAVTLLLLMIYIFLRQGNSQ